MQPQMKKNDRSMVENISSEQFAEKWLKSKSLTELKKVHELISRTISQIDKIDKKKNDEEERISQIISSLQNREEFRAVADVSEALSNFIQNISSREYVEKLKILNEAIWSKAKEIFLREISKKDEETIDNMAWDIANTLFMGDVTSTQMRNVFNLISSALTNLEENVENTKKALLLAKPKIAYMVKKKENRDLVDIYLIAVTNAVRENKKEVYRNLAMLNSAILGYFKYLEVSKSKKDI